MGLKRYQGTLEIARRWFSGVGECVNSAGAVTVNGLERSLPHVKYSGLKEAVAKKKKKKI